jgi:hypothetical protein
MGSFLDKFSKGDYCAFDLEAIIRDREHQHIKAEPLGRSFAAARADYNRM